MKSRMFVLFTVLFALLLLSGVPLKSDDKSSSSEFAFYKNDTIKIIIEKNMGKRVAITLNSGAEFEGVVAAVGSHVVHLTHLSGKSFYDALIQVDRVSAVTVRVRGK